MRQVRRYALTASMNGSRLRQSARFVLNAQSAARIAVCSSGLLMRLKALNVFSVNADVKISSSTAESDAPVALPIAGHVDPKRLDGLNNWFPPRH
jgi:hypothetical protein